MISDFEKIGDDDVESCGIAEADEAFGLRVMKLCGALPRSRSANVIAKQ